MRHLLRRLRGVAGIGLVWGIVWAALVAVLVIVVAVVDPDSIDPGEGPLVAGAIFGWVGFLSGSGFGILLALAASGKAIRDVSLRLAALCGILGSAAFPLLTGREDQAIITCTLGAVLGTGLVAIARNAVRHGSGRRRSVRVVLTLVLKQASRNRA